MLAKSLKSVFAEVGLELSGMKHLCSECFVLPT